MWGRQEDDDYEPSAFNTEGQKPFPPTYQDNKNIGDFSDEQRWPIQKLMGRLALYEAFLKRDDLMPRAKETARRIKDHLMFELLYREGFFNITNDNDSDESDMVEHVGTEQT